VWGIFLKPLGSDITQSKNGALSNRKGFTAGAATGRDRRQNASKPVLIFFSACPVAKPHVPTGLASLATARLQTPLDIGNGDALHRTLRKRSGDHSAAHRFAHAPCSATRLVH